MQGKGVGMEPQGEKEVTKDGENGETVRLGRVRCIRRPNGKEAYACFSGDEEIGLDGHCEAAYNSSSAIRVS